MKTREKKNRVWQPVRETMIKTAAIIADTIVPPACLACEVAVGHSGLLCGACWSSLRIIEKPYCKILGTPFPYDTGDGAISLQAIANPPAFDRSRSAVLYDGVARTLVQGLKFSDRTELAPWMAQWMVRASVDILSPNVLIVPVPLHRWRMLSRKFNQSAELARNFAFHCRAQYNPEILQRIRSTRPQVGLRTTDRLRNVQGAFRVPTEQEIHVKARHIVLIDDVFTTGATLQACARALRRKGASRIDCLTFARVPNGVAIDDL